MTRVSALAVGPGAEAATGSVGFWAGAAVLGLLVAVGASVRLVGSQECAVVSRFGRVVRVRGPGVVLWLPGVERVVTVSLRAVEMPLVVSVETKDGVTVQVMATAVCRPGDPALWAIQAAPLDSAAMAVEEALQRETSERRLVELPHQTALVQTLLPVQVSTRTATWGVEVTEVRIGDIETRLTPQLLRTLQGR